MINQKISSPTIPGGLTAYFPAGDIKTYMSFKYKSISFDWDLKKIKQMELKGEPGDDAPPPPSKHYSWKCKTGKTHLRNNYEANVTSKFFLSKPWQEITRPVDLQLIKLKMVNHTGFILFLSSSVQIVCLIQDTHTDMLHMSTSFLSISVRTVCLIQDTHTCKFHGSTKNIWRSIQIIFQNLWILGIFLLWQVGHSGN